MASYIGMNSRVNSLNMRIPELYTLLKPYIFEDESFAPPLPQNILIDSVWHNVIDKKILIDGVWKNIISLFF